jgi:hypothetical protein
MEVSQHVLITNDETNGAKVDIQDVPVFLSMMLSVMESQKQMRYSKSEIYSILMSLQL